TLSKFIYLSYLFLNFTFILFTRSRSALLAVVFGILLFLISYLFLIKKDFKKIFLILTFIVVVPILLFKTGIGKVDDFVNLNRLKLLITKTKKNDQTQVKNNFKDSNNNLNITDSADIRKIVWQGAIKLGLKYPLFGTGVETFAYSYYFVRPLAHNYTSEWDFVYNKAHNEFLNYLATTGFFGLGAYILLIISFYYLLSKQILIIKNTNKKHFDSHQLIFLLILAIAYLTILITNFFGFSTTTINIFFFLFPAALIVSFKKDKFKETKTLKITYDQYLAMIIITVFLFYLLLSLFFYRQADVNYNLANNYFKIQEYQKAYYYLQSALKLRTEPVYEDKYSTILALLAVFAHHQKQDKLANELIILSKDYNNKTLATSPKNIFYLKTRAKNYYYYYQISSSKDDLLDGIQTLKITQKLAPTDPKIPYSLAIFYLQLASIEKDIKQKKVWQNLAVDSINQSLELKNDYQDALALKKEIEKNNINSKSE
ncbi:MAG: O-antigen ligase family protein, partial [Microgenomates group bacterium]